LLRGINVGGNNIIKITELKDCFESLCLGDVATYIQSGNVPFTAAKQKRKARGADRDSPVGAALESASASGSHDP
jgi:uncharacterized protein (DUF1697 family)